MEENTTVNKNNNTTVNEESNCFKYFFFLKNLSIKKVFLSLIFMTIVSNDIKNENNKK